MIGMGAKSITVVRAATANFVFDCRAAEVANGRFSSERTVGYHGNEINKPFHSNGHLPCIMWEVPTVY
jgi:hypothetical protein